MRGPFYTYEGGRWRSLRGAKGLFSGEEAGTGSGKQGGQSGRQWLVHRVSNRGKEVKVKDAFEKQLWEWEDDERRRFDADSGRFGREGAFDAEALL